MRFLCRFAGWLYRRAGCRETRRLIVVRIVDLETGLTATGDIRAMRITTTQQAEIEWGKPVDRKGRPAKVQEGSVKIECSDDSVTIEQRIDDPFKATVKGVRDHGEGESAVITITADADTGEGVRTITGVEPLVVVAAEAVGFGPATVGEPIEQPD